jgi:aryl-alcohol dehydrogenase-like predicted oxidoreductase
MTRNRIAIGTVQFGIPYGINNKNKKKVCSSEISKILNLAKSAGIDTIDTAMSYGNSENELGYYGVSQFKIITKLPAIPKDCPDLSKWVEEQLMNSLLRLKLSKVYGLIIHNPEDLLGSLGSELWDILNNFKEKKLINKIGYSIYSPNELDTIFDLFSPDIVQAPYNIFDRRLDKSGWMNRLSNAKIEIHVRSVFLQGLLLIDKKDRPKKFDKWSNFFEKFDLWLQKNNLNAAHAAISFVTNDPRISKIILGIDNSNQLEEALKNLDIKINNFPDELHLQDIDLINPSRWNLL